MKTFLFLLIATVSFAQSPDDFKKINSKGCDLWKYNDDFENTVTFHSDFFVGSKMNYSGKPVLQIMFFKKIKTDGVIEYSALFTGSVEACRDDRAYVALLLQNGEKVRLDCKSRGIKCGTNSMTVAISLDQFKTITKNVITKIRLQYNDLNDDFEVNDKAMENISNRLTCIASTAI